MEIFATFVLISEGRYMESRKMILSAHFPPGKENNFCKYICEIMTKIEDILNKKSISLRPSIHKKQFLKISC